MLGYISVKDSIKRLKKAYVGVESNKIIEKEGYVELTGNNITDYFETYQGGVSYTFKDSNNNGIFVAENIGIHDSYAYIKLTAKRDIKTLKFNYYSRTEGNSYDYFEIIHKGSRVVYQTGSDFTEKTYTANDIKQGDVFVFKYTKDGSVHADPEYAQFSNFQVWDKVKSVEGELGDYAKRIYKIYVGSKENKAKLMYEEGKIWHKKLDNLVVPMSDIGATRLGSLALFAGGTDINSYSKSLTHGTIDIGSFRSHMSATTVNNTAFFGFGQDDSGNRLNTVLTLNDGTIEDIEIKDCYLSTVASACCDKYAMFGGGVNNYNASVNTTIAVDSATGTYSLPTVLSYRVTQLSGCTCFNKAIFCGGYLRYSGGTIGPYTSINSYNTSLTRGTYYMSTSRMNHTSNSLGQYLVIAGGQSTPASTTPTYSIDIFTEEFTRSSLTLNQGRYSHASVVIDNLLILSGGSSGNSRLNSIEIFDENLTEVEYDNLELFNAKTRHASVALDNIGIFAGGIDSNSVECFIV